MADPILEQVHWIQKDLEEKAARVVHELGVEGSDARARVRKAWRQGCILCKQHGSRHLYFYKKHVVVVCPDCYVEKKLEAGEGALNRSIARRLARRAKAPGSKN